MKYKMVFYDWVLRGKSIYAYPAGVELSMRDLHSGSSWEVDIALPPNIEQEIMDAARDRSAQPAFYLVVKPDPIASGPRCPTPASGDSPHNSGA